MIDLGLNERAWRIADDAVERAAEMRVGVHTLDGGTRILDAGLERLGGLAAGLALARMCMGGLGTISITPLLMDGASFPGVCVWTDHPATACMASQYAGWSIAVGKWFAMGSGPLRAIARVERELFARLAYVERASRGVLVLEGRRLPTPEVAAWIADKSGIDPSRLTLAVAPTASLAASVQVVARVLETGLHKMDLLGFDVRRVVSGIGTAPLPPLARDDLEAIGRTNDAVLYGGEARFVVDADDAELESLAAKLPASVSPDHGTPFAEIFERYGRDFYKIDPALFSPASVALTSARSGRTARAGTFLPSLLRRSFYGG